MHEPQSPGKPHAALLHSRPHFAQVLGRRFRGALRAGTGSGNIMAYGNPRGDWKLDTGSGNVP